MHGSKLVKKNCKHKKEKGRKEENLGLARQTGLEPVFQVVAAAISIIQPVVVVADTIIAVILSR